MFAMAQSANANVRAVGKGDARQRLERWLTQAFVTARIAPKMKRMTAVRLNRERDVIQRAEVRKKRADLKRAGDAGEAAAIWRQGRNIGAVKTDCPALRRNLAGQQ